MRIMYTSDYDMTYILNVTKVRLCTGKATLCRCPIEFLVQTGTTWERYTLKDKISTEGAQDMAIKLLSNGYLDLRNYTVLHEKIISDIAQL